MNEFKIKYSKKYILDCIEKSLGMIVFTLIFNTIFKEKSIFTTIVYIIGIVGFISLCRNSRFLFNGGTYAKITFSYIKFSNGRKVNLSDINAIYIGINTLFRKRYESLYIETISGHRIELAKHDVHDLQLNELKSRVQALIDANTLPRNYDDNISIKYSNSYIYLLALFIIPIIYFITKVVLKKQNFMIISISLFISYLYIMRDRIYTSLYKDKLILKNGNVIHYNDIIDCYIRTKDLQAISKYKDEDSDYYLVGKRKFYKKRHKIKRTLYIVTKSGNKFKVCESHKLNYTPLEIQNVLYYKFDKGTCD